MYGAEQRKKAVETFDRFGCSAADTIAELGYPSRPTLLNWWREYQIGATGSWKGSNGIDLSTGMGQIQRGYFASSAMRSPSSFFECTSSFA